MNTETYGASPTNEDSLVEVNAELQQEADLEALEAFHAALQDAITAEFGQPF
jgi:hypothetical protein